MLRARTNSDDHDRDGEREILNDDLQRNGLKPYDWGPSYWTIYQSWSFLLPQAATHPLLLEFFFLTPRDLFPCVHCRRHFREYCSTVSVRRFIDADRLPEFWYLVH